MNNSELSHHGVLGMKWGKHLAGSQSVTAEASKATASTRNIANSVRSINNTSNSDNPTTLSDQDLKNAVNRMSLEQQYSSLTSNKTSRGESYVNDILGIAGSALAVVSSAATIALAIQKIKG